MGEAEAERAERLHGRFACAADTVVEIDGAGAGLDVSFALAGELSEIVRRAQPCRGDAREVEKVADIHQRSVQALGADGRQDMGGLGDKRGAPGGQAFGPLCDDRPKLAFRGKREGAENVRRAPGRGQGKFIWREPSQALCFGSIVHPDNG